MKLNESCEESSKRYNAAAHAMQSGIAMLMNYPADMAAVAPKHLRVGINSAHVTDAALAALLMEKGIFTREEYGTAVADAMERERDRCAKTVEALLGRPVTLA